MEWETDQKMDRDKLQIQGLERNLDQLCYVPGNETNLLCIGFCLSVVLS